MVWAPDVTVAAIVEKNKQFLIVEENTRSGIKLNQPAGHLEPNESLIDAVIRETQEETAYTIQPQYLVGIYRWFSQENNITYLRFCFYAEEISHHEQQTLDTGIIQALWLSQSELESNPTKCRSPLVIESISDYLAGKSYPLSILSDQLISP